MNTTLNKHPMRICLHLGRGSFSLGYKQWIVGVQSIVSTCFNRCCNSQGDHPCWDHQWNDAGSPWSGSNRYTMALRHQQSCNNLCDSTKEQNWDEMWGDISASFTPYHTHTLTIFMSEGAPTKDRLPRWVWKSWVYLDWQREDDIDGRLWSFASFLGGFLEFRGLRSNIYGKI